MTHHFDPADLLPEDLTGFVDLTGIVDGDALLWDSGSGLFVPGAPGGGGGGSLSDADTADVNTNESTTSTTFTDLATAGPAVTVTIGASGLALVTVVAFMLNTSSVGQCRMAFEVSGATTRAVDLNDAAIQRGTATATTEKQTLLLGLAAGATTFTAKYATAGTSSSASFNLRRIIVLAL